MTDKNELKIEFTQLGDTQSKIDSITKYQKRYIANSLKKLALKNPQNVKVICDYIIAEQNEINVKK
ncbi:MAG TPA: hypothetical protein VH481_02330 [Nitrososphaeraceae archaeon]